MYYLSHLNTTDSNKEDSSENSESTQGCSINLCKNSCLDTENGILKLRYSKNIEGERNANVQMVIKLQLQRIGWKITLLVRMFSIFLNGTWW